MHSDIHNRQASKHADRIQHDRELSLAYGQPAEAVLNDHVYALRKRDSDHGRVNGSQFQSDRQEIARLHQRELLPHLEIVGHNLHTGAPGNLNKVQLAAERARAGGRPLNIAQIGDSHVAAGTQTRTLAKTLAAEFGLNEGQINFSAAGAKGKSASYAASHPDRFLGKINGSTDLVVVSFGSNEAGKQAGASYVNDYARLIHQIRDKAPNASIVMVGPTDGAFWNTNKRLPGLDSIVAAQKGVQATVADSAYLDPRQAMGYMQSMRSRNLLSGDNLHLTTSGYQLLGSLIAHRIKVASTSETLPPVRQIGQA